MSDLWTEATRDLVAESNQARLTAARVNVAEVWPFLAAATSEVDYGNRKSLAFDRIERAVIATVGDVDQGLLEELEQSLDQDYAALHQARTAAEMERTRVSIPTQLREAGHTVEARTADDGRQVYVVDGEEMDLRTAADRFLGGWDTAFGKGGSRTAAEGGFNCARCGKPATHYAFDKGHRASGMYLCSKHAAEPEVVGDRTVEKTALRRSAEDGKTCVECGAAIERDPAGEEPRTWHHADGQKHEHEARPAESKDAKRKASVVTGGRYCKTHQVWIGEGNASNHDEACKIEEKATESSLAAHTAAPHSFLDDGSPGPAWDGSRGPESDHRATVPEGGSTHRGPRSECPLCATGAGGAAPFVAEGWVAETPDATGPRIDTPRKVVQDHAWAKIDALAPAAQARFDSVPLQDLVDFGWRHTGSKDSSSGSNNGAEPGRTHLPTLAIASYRAGQGVVVTEGRPLSVQAVGVGDVVVLGETGHEWDGTQVRIVNESMEKDRWGVIPADVSVSSGGGGNGIWVPKDQVRQATSSFRLPAHLLTAQGHKAGQEATARGVATAAEVDAPEHYSEDEQTDWMVGVVLAYKQAAGNLARWQGVSPDETREGVSLATRLLSAFDALSAEQRSICTAAIWPEVVGSVPCPARGVISRLADEARHIIAIAVRYPSVLSAVPTSTTFPVSDDSSAPGTHEASNTRRGMAAANGETSISPTHGGWFERRSSAEMARAVVIAALGTDHFTYTTSSDLSMAGNHSGSTTSRPSATNATLPITVKDSHSIYEALRKGAPFADYDSWEDCISKNQDAADPEAYCGKIKHQVEDGKKGSLRTASVAYLYDDSEGYAAEVEVNADTEAEVRRVISENRLFAGGTGWVQIGDHAYTYRRTDRGGEQEVAVEITGPVPLADGAGVKTDGGGQVAGPTDYRYAARQVHAAGGLDNLGDDRAKPFGSDDEDEDEDKKQAASRTAGDVADVMITPIGPMPSPGWEQFCKTHGVWLTDSNAHLHGINETGDLVCDIELRKRSEAAAQYAHVAPHELRSGDRIVGTDFVVASVEPSATEAPGMGDHVLWRVTMADGRQITYPAPSSVPVVREGRRTVAGAGAPPWLNKGKDEGGDKPAEKKPEQPAEGGSEFTPGQQVTISYTLATGATGTLPGTFESEQNGQLFFDCETGRFAVTEQGSDYVDSQGTKFTFEQVEEQAPDQQPAQQPPPVQSSLRVEAGFPLCARGCQFTLSAADDMINTERGLAHRRCPQDRMRTEANPYQTGQAGNPYATSGPGTTNRAPTQPGDALDQTPTRQEAPVVTTPMTTRPRQQPGVGEEAADGPPELAADDPGIPGSGVERPGGTNRQGLM